MSRAADLLRDLYFSEKSAYALIGPTDTASQLDSVIDAMRKGGK